MKLIWLLTIFIQLSICYFNEFTNIQYSCQNFENYTKIYKDYFALVKRLAIVRVYEENHMKHSKFMDEFIANFQQNQKSIFNFQAIRPPKKIDKKDQLNFITIQGIVIIAENIENFRETMQINPLLFTSTRILYAVFLLEIENCNKIRKEIRKTLRKLWEKLQILNILIQTPCHCDKFSTYTFNPFALHSNRYGTMETYKTNQNEKIENYLDNLNGFPLSISLFNRPPTSIRDPPDVIVENPIYKDLKKYGNIAGVDGTFLMELAKYMNFNVIITDRHVNGEFGRNYRNGTITGSLGAVIAHDVDFAGNGRFVIQYGKGYEFTKPLTKDQLCIIVPKSKTVPQWLGVFGNFHWKTWCLMVLVLITCWIFWTFTTNSRSRAWLELMALFITAPILLRNLNYAQKIFVGHLLIFVVIISSIYQGNLFDTFTSVSYYKEIDSLEDLDRSGLNIATSLTQAFDSDPTEDVLKRLNGKIVDVEGISIRRTAYDRNVAALERQRDAEIFRYIYVDKKGISLLHIVKECPVSYFVAYIVPMGSPFLNKINQFLTKIIESGLSNKWYNDIHDYMVLRLRYRIEGNEDGVEELNLYDLQAAFYILFLGNTVAFSVFLCEYYFKFYRLNRAIQK